MTDIELEDSDSLDFKTYLHFGRWILLFTNHEVQKDYFALSWNQHLLQRRVVSLLFIMLVVVEGHQVWVAPFVWVSVLRAIPMLVCFVITLLPASRFPARLAQSLSFATSALSILVVDGVVDVVVSAWHNFGYHAQMSLNVFLVLIGLGCPFVLSIPTTLVYAILHHATYTHKDYVNDGYFYVAAVICWVMCYTRDLRDANLYVKEKQLEHEHKRAENLWKRRTDASKAKAEALSQVKFLSTMSHELRTPLTAVIGASSLLVEDLADEQHELANIVFSGARATLDLVNNVLDFSKLKAGEVTIVAKPTRLIPFVDGIVQILDPLAAQKSISLEVDVQDNLHDVTVSIDKGRVRQILLNFGSNAIRFAPREGTVTMKVTRDGEHALLFSVSDSGPGISEDNLGDVFKPFVQLEAEVVSGTGLGLSISKQLAELMDGRVWVESVLGQGSTFIFEAPVTISLAATESPATLSARTSTPILGGLEVRVLVAEDQPLSQRVIGKMITKAGYEYDMTSDGVKTVETYTANPHCYFVVLMDCQMPNMDGYAATRKIREFEREGGYDATHILALTAEALPNDRVKCLEAGMSGYMTKPVTYEVLKAELDRVVAAGKAM